MPFYYDAESGILASAVGNALRALSVDKTHKVARVIKHYPGHQDRINTLLIDHHQLLSASTVIINHNLATGRERWRALGDFGKRIDFMRVRNDVLFVQLQDCSLVLVHARNGAVIAKNLLKPAFAGGLPYFTLEINSRQIVAHGNHTVNVYAAGTLRRLFNVDLSPLGMFASGVSSAHKMIYGGAGDGGVRAYRFVTGETQWSGIKHTEKVTCLIVSEYWEMVISASADGTMCGWDLKLGHLKWAKQVFHDKSGITHMAESMFRWTVVIGGNNGRVEAWNIKGTPVRLWADERHLFPIQTLQIVTPWGKLAKQLGRFIKALDFDIAISEDEEGQLQCRDARTGAFFWVWEPPLWMDRLSGLVAVKAGSRGRASIGSVRTVVSVQQNGSLRVMSAADAHVLWRTSAADGMVASYAMDYETYDKVGNGFLVAGMDIGALVVYNEANGRRIWKVGGMGAVRQVVTTQRVFWSYNLKGKRKKRLKDRMLLSWSTDSTVRAFDIRTGAEYWSCHDVEADVGLFCEPASTLVVAVSSTGMTSMLLETGAVVARLEFTTPDNPVQHADSSARIKARPRKSLRRKVSRVLPADTLSALMGGGGARAPQLPEELPADTGRTRRTQASHVGSRKTTARSGFHHRSVSRDGSRLPTARTGGIGGSRFPSRASVESKARPASRMSSASGGAPPRPLSRLSTRRSRHSRGTRGSSRYQRHNSDSANSLDDEDGLGDGGGGGGGGGHDDDDDDDDDDVEGRTDNPQDPEMQGLLLNVGDDDDDDVDDIGDGLSDGGGGGHRQSTGRSRPSSRMSRRSRGTGRRSRSRSRGHSRSHSRPASQYSRRSRQHESGSGSDSAGSDEPVDLTDEAKLQPRAPAVSPLRNPMAYMRERKAEKERLAALERKAPRCHLVACLLANGDFVVVNAEDGELEGRFLHKEYLAGSDPSLVEVEDPTPESVQGRIALYEGFGLVGRSTIPLVILAMGVNQTRTLRAHEIYTRRPAWELDYEDCPLEPLTMLRSCGKLVYVATAAGIDVLDCQTGLLKWAVHPQKGALNTAYLLTSREREVAQPKGVETFVPGKAVAEGLFLGHRSGAVYSLSVKARMSVWGGVTMMQMAPAYGHEMYVDENPAHPSYHPPPSGGQAGLRKIENDKLVESYQQWVHTKATSAHEWKTAGRFVLSTVLWFVQVFQMSYFPVRGPFPPLMKTWRDFSELTVTLGFSPFNSEDPAATGRINPTFWPGYSVALFFALFIFVMAIVQVWLAEFVLRAPRSVFRRGFWELVQLIGQLSYTVLFLPVSRLVVAPFVCNKPVARVATEILRDQMGRFPTSTPIDPRPAVHETISAGRDIQCGGGVDYLQVFALSVVVSLLWFPLILRMLGVGGDFTLLRHSRWGTSAVGGWNRDDTFLAMKEEFGRDHALSVRRRVIGYLYCLLRLTLLLIAMAGLPSAWESLLLLGTFGVLMGLLSVSPLFHDRLANLWFKSMLFCCLILAGLGFLSSLWVRPIGTDGDARDGFLSFLVVVGVPGSIVVVWMEDALRQKLCGGRPLTEIIARRCKKLFQKGDPRLMQAGPGGVDAPSDDESMH